MNLPFFFLWASFQRLVMTGVSDHSPQFQFYLDAPPQEGTMDPEKNKASAITAYFKNQNNHNVY